MVVTNMFIKFKLFSGVLFSSFALLGCCNLTKDQVLNELSKERYFPYQDIIINNELIFKGVGPDCASRYAAIRSVLDKYNRPIKVLDLGASNGYFSLKIANDYRALCVMVDVSDRLCKICEFNDKVNNIIYLKKEFLLEDLILLKNKEHFDVILALNVVHHMSQWKDVLDVIFELGSIIIIETPPSNDSRSVDNSSVPLIEEYLLSKSNGIIIAKTHRAPANNFDGVINSLNANENFLAQKEYTPNAYASMFCFGVVNNEDLKLPAFDLQTFKVLNGVFPFNLPIDQDKISLK